MNELAIALSTDAKECLYQQIYVYIKKEIRTGKLLQGEKLPSTRSLAEYLQVARSTVDLAYGQLQAEGYITAKPCKGFFVAGMENLFELSETEHVTQTENERGTVTEAADEERAYQYHFSPHAISMKDFPFATWKRINRDILVEESSELFALGDAQGDYELRQTICRYLHSARGVVCMPEQIIVGAGTDYLLMLLEKILGRQIPIAMENPTYQRAYRVFASFAYEIETLPMDESGISIEALYQSKAKVAYVMPSHQYPTGIVMPIGRRLELLKWAGQEPDRYLIEDDYDSEFRYKGKPVPALQASDRNGKVIYLGTFSKSIAPAIRVGYMVLPMPLLKVYKKNCGFYASTVSRIDQKILNEFIRNGHFERYLNKMRKIYREKHDYLLECLQEFEDAFAISGENAGLHVLLTSKKGVSEEELIKSAKENKIRLYGLGDALIKGAVCAPAYQNTILLGYGALTLTEIVEGIAALKEAWREYI